MRGHKVTVTWATKREGVSKKSGKPYKIVTAEALLYQFDTAVGRERPYQVEFALPEGFDETTAGDHVAVFELAPRVIKQEDVGRTIVGARCTRMEALRSSSSDPFVDAPLAKPAPVKAA